MEEKIVYHEGDLVAITNPIEFIRCGYDNTPKNYIKDVKKVLTAKVQKTVHDTYDVEISDWLIEKICWETAYKITRKEGFGSSERKIFERPLLLPVGTSGYIINKKVVKTGYRCEGSSGGGWYSEYDYDPPYLANEKAHVILKISPHESTNHFQIISNLSINRSSHSMNESFEIRREYVMPFKQYKTLVDKF